MPAKKKVGPSSRLLTFRVEESVMASLDHYAKTLTKNNPGMPYSRTDAARRVLAFWAAGSVEEREASK